MNLSITQQLITRKDVVDTKLPEEDQIYMRDCQKRAGPGGLKLILLPSRSIRKAFSRRTGLRHAFSDSDPAAKEVRQRKGAEKEIKEAENEEVRRKLRSGWRDERRATSEEFDKKWKAAGAEGPPPSGTWCVYWRKNGNTGHAHLKGTCTMGGEGVIRTTVYPPVESAFYYVTLTFHENGTITGRIPDAGTRPQRKWKRNENEPNQLVWPKVEDFQIVGEVTGTWRSDGDVRLTYPSPGTEKDGETAHGRVTGSRMETKNKELHKGEMLETRALIWAKYVHTYGGGELDVE